MDLHVFPIPIPLIEIFKPKQDNQCELESGTTAEDRSTLFTPRAPRINTKGMSGLLYSVVL